VLGIDIGSYSVKAATVRKSGKNAVIDQLACEILPENMRGGSINLDTLQKIVTKLIKTAGKGQSTIALSIPTSSSILETITVDSSLSGDLLEGEVQLELVNFVPFPLDQVYTDFVSLGRVQDDITKQEVFVVVSRRDIVDKVASSVDAKAIKNKEVDIECFAIGQIIERLKGKNYQGVYGILDIGYLASNLCVFNQGSIVFNREQQIGGQHLTEAIADAGGLSISDAENSKQTAIHSISKDTINTYLSSFSEQIYLAIEFYRSTNNENQIETIYLTGGGSLVPGMVRSLNEYIPEQNFARLPMGKDIRFKKVHGMNADYAASAATVACGLAMRV